MHKLSRLLYVLLIFATALLPANSVTRLPEQAITKNIGPQPIGLPLRASHSSIHDFWFYMSESLRASLQQKRIFSEELIGSVTSRFALIQQAYAATHTVTSNNGASIDTSTSMFGGGSGKFVASSSQYLSTSDSNDWYFASGDFTIDFWVRFNTLPASGKVAPMYEQRVSDSNRFAFWLYNNSGTNQWCAYLGGTGWIIQVTASVSAGTWYHVALVRSGNSWYVFQGGNQVGSTATNSASISDLAAPLWVGAHDLGGPATVSYLDGWLEEYRISKGIARWTSNFSPPGSAYSADSYTVLLLHMDGTNGSTTFLDSSAAVGPDFSISPSPTSQSVGAGGTASYVLNLAASGGYGSPTPTTITLSVTSGCPTGVTCTVAPNSIGSGSLPTTATLSVPTLITTPGGTTSVVVTASDGTITHTTSVTLTVAAPANFLFNVKGTATEIVVTLMYSWTGPGAPPQGSITIAGPGGTPTMLESAGVVYDRANIAVCGATNTYSLIHRVTFSITGPGSAQVWTVYVSLAGVSSYTMTIEVS